MANGEAHDWFLANNRSLPEDFAPPKMLPGASQFLAAFWRLSSDRPTGFGIGTIPFTALDAWAARNGICGDDFQLFADMIAAMDAFYLEKVRDSGN